jgi:hypothetical protein
VETISEFYEVVPADAPARRLLLDYYAWYADATWTFDGMPVEYMLDLAKASVTFRKKLPWKDGQWKKDLEEYYNQDKEPGHKP